MFGNNRLFLLKYLQIFKKASASALYLAIFVKQNAYRYACIGIKRISRRIHMTNYSGWLRKSNWILGEQKWKGDFSVYNISICPFAHLLFYYLLNSRFSSNFTHFSTKIFSVSGPSPGYCIAHRLFECWTMKIVTYSNNLLAPGYHTVDWTLPPPGWSSPWHP